jgi:hypothetical protein
VSSMSDTAHVPFLVRYQYMSRPCQIRNVSISGINMDVDKAVIALIYTLVIVNNAPKNRDDMI